MDDQFEAEARAPILFQMISSRGLRQVDTICSENPGPTKWYGGYSNSGTFI